MGMPFIAFGLADTGSRRVLGWIPTGENRGLDFGRIVDPAGKKFAFLLRYIAAAQPRLAAWLDNRFTTVGQLQYGGAIGCSNEGIARIKKITGDQIVRYATAHDLDLAFDTADSRYSGDCNCADTAFRNQDASSRHINKVFIQGDSLPATDEQ